VNGGFVERRVGVDGLRRRLARLGWH